MTSRFVASFNSVVDQIWIRDMYLVFRVRHTDRYCWHLYGMLHDMTACQPHRFHLLCDPVTTLFGRVKPVKIRDSWLILQAVSAASKNSEKKLGLRLDHCQWPCRAIFVPAQDFAVGAYGGVMSSSPWAG